MDSQLTIELLGKMSPVVGGALAGFATILAAVFTVTFSSLLKRIGRIEALLVEVLVKEKDAEGQRRELRQQVTAYRQENREMLDELYNLREAKTRMETELNFLTSGRFADTGET